MIGKLLFEFAKGDSIGNVVGLCFEFGSSLIPVKRLLSTKKMLGFYHPKPSYPHHILLVPKKKIRNHFRLSHPNYVSYFAEIWFGAQQIAMKNGWDQQDGYVLCSNGGPRQEVKQLHFHLFTKKHLVNGYEGDSPQKLIEQNEQIMIFNHPNPSSEIHLLLRPSQLMAGELRGNNQEIEQVLNQMLELIPRLNEQFHLEERGYTLLFQVNPDLLDPQQHLTMHIIAGKRI